MKLLLVEDDKLLGEGIKVALTHFSYSVDWVTRGQDAMPAIKSSQYSLAILDLGLPDIDGIELLENIRRSKIDLPVLVLTARDQTLDKITGLNAGADDYMVKPFDLRELEARIRTLTRRTHGRRVDTVELGRACLDISSRKLELDGQTMDFSRREFALVKAFFERPKHVYSREALESIMYSWDDDIESNSLEVHIHKLRKKMGAGAIKTVRGIGYMLVLEHFK